MADKLEINVEVTNPQTQLDKILASIGSSVAKVRKQFEKDIDNIIAKSGIKSGQFQFTGPTGYYVKGSNKVAWTKAEPVPPAIQIGPLTKNIDVAKQYSEQVKAQMQQFAFEMGRAKKLGRVSEIEKLLKQYEDLYSEEVRKRVPKQLWNKIEQNWLKYNDALDTTRKQLEDRNKKETVQTTQRRRDALAFAEELYTRNQEAKIKRREERDRQRSRQVMGLASAGIGIFGQAGFPLLNIAFASMSGMKYAGIAAVATAAGEAARFITRLQEAAKQSADSLGFVSKEAKIAAARFEATKVIYGVVVNMAEQAHANRAREQMTGNYSMQRASSFWANYRMVAYEQMTNLFLDFGAFVRAEGMATQAKRRTAEQMPNLYSELMKSREEYIKNSFQYKASFDSPENMWKRIQAAAMSRIPNQEEMRRETLKEFDKQALELQREQNGLLRGNNAALEENTKRVLENRGGGYFSFG